MNTAAESPGNTAYHFFPSGTHPLKKFKEGEMATVDKEDEGAGGAGDVTRIATS